MFKKTCFKCGKKTDTIYKGLCENCFKNENPPIKQIKPLNMKYCNNCKKIRYNNQYYTYEEIEKKIIDIIKKNITIDSHYKLNKLYIENFTINKAVIDFDIKVNCDLIKNS